LVAISILYSLLRIRIYQINPNENHRKNTSGKFIGNVIARESQLLPYFKNKGDEPKELIYVN
jgi:hypothetical protein